MSELPHSLPAEVVVDVAEDAVISAREIRSAVRKGPLRADVMDAALERLGMDVEDLQRWWHLEDTTSDEAPTAKPARKRPPS
jgi:hypothetical protein